jgi:Hint domain
MATGLNLSALDGLVLPANDFAILVGKPTQSAGGAWTPGTSVLNYGTGGSATFQSGSTPVTLHVTGSSANENITFTGFSGRSVGGQNSTTISFRNVHLLGWNEDGLLFTGLNAFQTFFIADPNGQAAGAVVSSAPPPNMTFGQDPSNIPFGLEVACFAEGTAIATPEGEAVIEALRVGDVVITASGAPRSVTWIGQSTVRPVKHPRPHEVNPVRVCAGAFGEDLPVRDLVLSPGHAVFVDGVLIPVGHLVNGATIRQEEVQSIRYFHVELESHDVLLAEGLPCESYFDDGNRASFANAGAFAELHGRLDPKSWDDACAPMVAAGPQLIEVQQRLHARTAELGWIKSEDADLVIEADGVTISPIHKAGNRTWFAVPAASSLTLRSNASVLAQVMPGLGDGRRLGIAVSSLRVDGAEVALESDAFGAGFYPVERHETIGWRWTNGESVLALDLAAPAMIEVNLAMVAPSWKRPATALRLVQAA